MPGSVIVSGARTPIGKYLGGLADVSAPQLAAVALKVRRARHAGDPGADHDDRIAFGFPAHDLLTARASGAGRAPDGRNRAA